MNYLGTRIYKENIPKLSTVSKKCESALNLF